MSSLKNKMLLVAVRNNSDDTICRFFFYYLVEEIPCARNELSSSGRENKLSPVVRQIILLSQCDVKVRHGLVRARSPPINQEEHGQTSSLSPYAGLKGPSRKDGLRRRTVINLTVNATSQIFATGTSEAHFLAQP